MKERWFDVLDEDAVWRVGECLYQDQKGMKSIAFDGFHPNYNGLFCQHSDKISPIRSKTKGLTVPEDKKPLRQVLSAHEIENMGGRLNLYLLKPNFLQFEPGLIRSSIRTEFLVTVDKIVSTPFQIIREVKMLDLQINKVFINLLNLFTRILDFSKVYMTMLTNGNQTAQELYKSIYELTIIVNLILGIHPHSKILYDHKLNINLKPTGLIDYMTVSQGIAPIRTFIKTSTTYLKGKKESSTLDMQISLGIIELFLEFCQRSKNELFEGENKARTAILVDEIITHLKTLGQTSQTVFNALSQNMKLIAKIEALYLKIKPNKQCNLRKFLSPKQQSIIIVSEPKDQLITEQKIDQQTKDKVQELELKIKKMEKVLVEQKFGEKQKMFQSQYKIKLPDSLYDREHQAQQKAQTENMGEQLFLSSVEWALETGDLEAAKKLVKWRKSILQIGRIAGWQTALLVGCRTFKKAEVSTEDIIEANYETLLRNSEK